MLLGVHFLMRFEVLVDVSAYIFSSIFIKCDVWATVR